MNLLYKSFHQAELLEAWFAPTGLKLSQFISDFQVGGDYRALFQSPEGFQQTIGGQYKCIDKNKRLTFTWRWDDTNDITKVDLRFYSCQNNTAKMIMHQTGFHKQLEMKQQQQEWMYCLEKLSLYNRYSESRLVA